MTHYNIKMFVFAKYRVYKEFFVVQCYTWYRTAHPTNEYSTVQYNTIQNICTETRCKMFNMWTLLIQEKMLGVLYNCYISITVIEIHRNHKHCRVSLVIVSVLLSHLRFCLMMVPRHYCDTSVLTVELDITMKLWWMPCFEISDYDLFKSKLLAPHHATKPLTLRSIAPSQLPDLRALTLSLALQGQALLA